jgi:hypothetical protein
VALGRCLTVLTISRLSRWSIRYYNDAADAARNAAMGREAAGGGWVNIIPMPIPAPRLGFSFGDTHAGPRELVHGVRSVSLKKKLFRAVGSQFRSQNPSLEFKRFANLQTQLGHALDQTVRDRDARTMKTSLAPTRKNRGIRSCGSAWPRVRTSTYRVSPRLAWVPHGLTPPSLPIDSF